MKHTLDIQKRLYQVTKDKSLSPRDKIKLLQEAAYIADENDDIEWSYEVRLRLLRQTRYINNRDLTFQVFTWLLNAYETHKDLFNEKNFLYKYTSILHIVFNNAKISRKQREAVYEDYKKRLERNGYNLFSYYHCLMDQLGFLGKIEEARECLDMCRKIGNDPMGNCDACYLDCEIDYFLAAGDFDEALTLAQPLIDGELSCAHVPMVTFIQLAVHAYELDKKEVAADLFEKGIVLLEECLNKKDETVISAMGQATRYLLLTAPEKAWRYLEISYPWYPDSSDFHQYRYSLNLLKGLKSLPPAQQVTIPFPTGSPYTPKKTAYR